MSVNTRERSEALQQAARLLLEERQIDITGQVDLRPLAKELAEQAQCHYSTARHHLGTAIRRARGEETARKRGGAREGAGYPKGVPRQPREPAPSPQTVTIRAGSPIRAAITHPGGGYELLGTGAATLQMAGPDRVVRVELGEGRTLVVTVF